MSDDQLADLERQIGRLLSLGVLICAALLVVGLVLRFAVAPVAGAGLLQTGLVILIAIPAARILASFADAVRRRDRLLWMATGLVLVILIASVVYPALSGR